MRSYKRFAKTNYYVPKRMNVSISLDLIQKPLYSENRIHPMILMHSMNIFPGGEYMGVSCARPVPTVEAVEAVAAPASEPVKKEVRNMILVGKPAPKFKAPAYVNGKFAEVDLADYAGKWVMLCFYPGDFTFV